MPKRFFRLTDDVYVPHRWHLAPPTDSKGHELDDPIVFNRGRPVTVEGRLRIPVEQSGRALDFSEAGTKVPVVHVRLASLFAERARSDVQLLPVDIEGQSDQYLILVATRLIRCIDEKASRIRLWTHEDGLPDMVGKYASVRDMRIDKAKVGEAQVFRTEGWAGTLIVSGEIKEALEHMGVTGTKFEEV
jgi:hypothetical protein